MKRATVETWAWVLLYGGLIVFSLGLFVPAEADPLPSIVRSVGGLAAVIGVLLILLRSRMGD